MVPRVTAVAAPKHPCGWSLPRNPLPDSGHSAMHPLRSRACFLRACRANAVRCLLQHNGAGCPFRAVALIVDGPLARLAVRPSQGLGHVLLEANNPLEPVDQIQSCWWAGRCLPGFGGGCRWSREGPHRTSRCTGLGDSGSRRQADTAPDGPPGATMETWRWKTSLPAVASCRARRRY